MDRETRSPLAGFLIAGPAALVVWLCALETWVYITQGPLRAMGLLPYAIMGGVLMGLPLVAALILLFAFPLSLALRRTIGVSLQAGVIAGALCGVIARLVVDHAFGLPETLFLPWPVVLATGAITGWIWWRAAQNPGREAGSRGAV